MDKELILLRGLPGSGKSTVAKLLAADYGRFKEADMFFMENGVYKFDPSKIKDAHVWCKNEVEYLMIYDARKIVVSNTFTQAWEMAPYYELAEKYGYRVHSLVVENRHNGVNEHNVPEESLIKMRNRFEIKL